MIDLIQDCKKVLIVHFYDRLDLILQIPPGAGRDQARLQWLKDIISSVSEGRKLLSLAEASGTIIIFNGALERKTKGAFEHTPGTTKIMLNPRWKTTQLVQTLLHELRHLWQHRVMDFTRRDGLSMEDSLVFTRLIEGDANAFSAAITEKINDCNNISLPVRTYGWMGFSRPQESGEIARRVFSNYQKSATARDYDRKALDRPFKTASGLSLSATFNSLHVVASGGMMRKPFYLEAQDLRELFDRIRCEIPDRTYLRAQKKSRDMPRHGF